MPDVPRPTVSGKFLRVGGEKLYVRGVSYGTFAPSPEHGDYPVDQKGQKLYPRYEFFQQCVTVFDKDKRAVPVYNDKHLSYSFEKAQRKQPGIEPPWPEIEPA